MTMLNPEFLFSQLEALNAFEVARVDKDKTIRSLKRCLENSCEYRICRIVGLALRFDIEAELIMGALLYNYFEKDRFKKIGYENITDASIDFAVKELNLSAKYALKLINLSRSLVGYDHRLGKIANLPRHKIHWYHTYINDNNFEAWVRAVDSSGIQRDTVQFKKLLRRHSAEIRALRARKELEMSSSMN